MFYDNHGQVILRDVRVAYCLWLIALGCIVFVLSSSQSLALDDSEYTDSSTDFSFRVERLANNPIIHRDMEGFAGREGENINGPSLIRVPDWIENPLGKYYLYFAHHHGEFIRMAYADDLEGPWVIHEGGVLHMHDTPSFHNRRGDHIASPDVLVDEENKRIIMYYHGLPIPNTGAPYQMTFVALSEDGLNFESKQHQLGLFYFRVFRHNDDRHYALAKYINDGGIMYRSRDGISKWEPGPRILPRVRHMALWQHKGKMYVFFSRGRDAPEHIMVSRIENLDDGWSEWRFTKPQTVLKPEEDWEGANEPVQESRFGAINRFVHQLRDPAIYEEDGRVFLLYSAAGEYSIGIAEIELVEGADNSLNRD